MQPVSKLPAAETSMDVEMPDADKGDISPSESVMQCSIET